MWWSNEIKRSEEEKRMREEEEVPYQHTEAEMDESYWPRSLLQPLISSPSWTPDTFHRNLRNQGSFVSPHLSPGASAHRSFWLHNKIRNWHFSVSQLQHGCFLFVAFKVKQTETEIKFSGSQNLDRLMLWPSFRTGPRMGGNWTGFRFLVLLFTFQTLQTPDPVPHSSHQEISLQPSKNQAIINNIRNKISGYILQGLVGLCFINTLQFTKAIIIILSKFASVIVV